LKVFNGNIKNSTFSNLFKNKSLKFKIWKRKKYQELLLEHF